ncbi:MAG: NADH-quinone oxidoreductase subunit H [Desulfobulbaceae bacterium]|nr:NADH-quinone oxidoreductase subunit H [Desulfobulbaceae bacterium]
MLTHLLAHLLLLFVLPPLLAGVIARTKAVIAGRRGAPLLQLYFDLWKLFRKGMVISSTTTWVFRAGPVIGLAVPVLASLFIPMGGIRAPISFAGDLILFVYLFGLARFFTVLAALDTGSSFEGMGAAREVTFSCLAEPTIFVIFIVLARISGSFSLDPMLDSLQNHIAHPEAGVPLLLAGVCLFVVLLAENCRIPFDDPNTHLELTMIHEVMVLDHSGPDLALILYGAAMKFLVMGAVLVSFIMPPHPASWFMETAAFTSGLLLLAVVVGLVESAMARLRLIRVPQLLVGTSLLSIFALVLLLR